MALGQTPVLAAVKGKVQVEGLSLLGISDHPNSESHTPVDIGQKKEHESTWIVAAN